MTDSMMGPFKNWISDKRGIGLLDQYESMFASIKDKPITFLEVGVAHGDSLQWARDFFPNATIYGMDIYVPHHIPDNVTVTEMNQNDTEGLKWFGKNKGPFDIIIDDASHAYKETVNTFNVLYPHLKPDGIYIIEDWGAGYLKGNDHCKGVETFVIEQVWKYGGHIVNEQGNYAMIDGAAHKGYGGFAAIKKG